ncbi:hypothetical protein LNQ81_16230 [Myroides sp. M-43]|uniref:hypothetical protein n=1 Tax=Myroides oncorhynchi TaxID=2893756 RepID=UPI001E2D4FD4|nr:hypothetical protein [Myroides oncorhynchi]MCC9044220.1 hypothetical protein [Myroides oncorhynchi]
MIKKIILAILILTTCNLLAQPIGVNTVTPMTDFHLNGSLQVTKDLNVKGSRTSKGTPGKVGQVLMSKGSDKSPEWVALSIPIVPAGSFTMIKSDVLIDSKGVVFQNGSSKRQYSENEDITTGANTDAAWKPFADLIYTIEITKPQNKTNLTLQTIGHLSNDYDSGNDPTFTFSIGFFIDGKLKAVKPFGVYGGAMSFTVVTLIATVENLPVGKHTLRVAAIPRLKDQYKGNLAIGIPNDKSTNLSSFMTNTSLQIDVLEVLN